MGEGINFCAMLKLVPAQLHQNAMFSSFHTRYLSVHSLSRTRSFITGKMQQTFSIKCLQSKHTYTHNPHTQKFIPLKTGHNSNEMEKLLSQWLMIRYIYIGKIRVRDVCVCVCLWHSFPKRNINYSLSDFTHTQFESMIKKSRGNRLVHS